MKAYVYVSMKKSVLDPQGKTIQGALTKMGYKGVADVRQGKYFELSLDGSLDPDAARAEVERMASEVLTNPVIEEFHYSIEDYRHCCYNSRSGGFPQLTFFLKGMAHVRNCWLCR